MTFGTILALVYIGGFIWLVYNRPTTSIIWGVMGFLVILIYSACCAAGDYDERDSRDIRRE